MRNKPPLWIFRLLGWFCPARLVEEIEGDLIQKFNRDINQYGEHKAKRRLMWNVIRFFRAGIIFRNKFLFHFNDIPMFKNYFLSAIRHIHKNKINAFSKVGGLTLAFFSFMIIALYVFYQLSFDRYHDDYQNIYRVNTERKENDKAEKYGISPMAFGPMFYKQFPEIEAYTRIELRNGSHVRYNEKVLSFGVFPADSTLFDVLTFKFIKGDRNALKSPGSIVLTKSIADNLFGKDDPMNKVLTLNNGKELYTVTAIIENVPPNTHFHVDAFIPISKEIDFNINNITSPVEFIDKSCLLYIKFRHDVNAKLFLEKLEPLLEKYVSKKDRELAGFKVFLQPIANIFLDTRYKHEFAWKGSALYLYIFIALGILLLVVAGINYINLSVADLTNRFKEIGIRKVMGARRRQIVTQIVLEALLFCCSALLLSATSLYILFPSVLQFLEPNLTFAGILDRSFLATIIFMLLFLIACSTYFPAHLLSTSSITNDLKGVFKYGGQARLGKILLVVQFIISIVCISATITISRQLNFVHTKDLGFERKNLLVLLMPEDFTVKKMQSFKHELKSITGVVAVSNSSFRIGGGFWKDWYTVEVDGEMKSFELYEVFSDDELFATLRMKLLKGRLFNANRPADSGAAFVINETAAKTLGWDDPIGKRIFTHPEEKGKWDGTVVGVVGDINISPLHEKIQPLVMRLPWQNRYPEYFIYVKIDEHSSEVIQGIKNKYKEILPGYPIDLEYVDDFYNSNYKRENKAYNSLQFATVIIIIISSIGIFSLSTYMSIRRMKEFGIRKVMGATTYQILVLHVGYFLRLTLIANAIALPIAYWLMTEWLNNFAYRTQISGFGFLFVASISFTIVIISGSYSAWKAGNMNPIDTIKIQ